MAYLAMFVFEIPCNLDDYTDIHLYIHILPALIKAFHTTDDWKNTCYVIVDIPDEVWKLIDVTPGEPKRQRDNRRAKGKEVTHQIKTTKRQKRKPIDWLPDRLYPLQTKNPSR